MEPPTAEPQASTESESTTDTHQNPPLGSPPSTTPRSETAGGLGLTSMIGRLLYSFYARRLSGQVQAGVIPQHVAVILDGNRRFAETLGSASSAVGYELGAQKVSQFLDWCQQIRIPQVTLWVLSADNLDRPESEIRPLLDVIEQEIVQIAARQRESRTPRRIRYLGQVDTLPPSLGQALRQAADLTSDFDDYFLNVAINYSGREEIIDAVRGFLVDYEAQGLSLGDAIRDVSPKQIASHLYLDGVPDPDLIIRTSGELRLSGFMLWQSVYSEFYFCDTYWPAFRQIDFLRAVRSFQQRRRRFGR